MQLRTDPLVGLLKAEGYTQPGGYVTSPNAGGQRRKCCQDVEICQQCCSSGSTKDGQEVNVMLIGCNAYLWTSWLTFSHHGAGEKPRKGIFSQ